MVARVTITPKEPKKVIMMSDRLRLSEGSGFILINLTAYGDLTDIIGIMRKPEGDTQADSRHCID
jgi:hypothetical protein